MTLSLRGVRVSVTSCCSCNSGLDETEHIFLACPFALDILEKIFKWCDISFNNASSVNRMVNFAAHLGNCPKKKASFSFSSFTVISVLFGGLEMTGFSIKRVILLQN